MEDAAFQTVELLAVDFEYQHKGAFQFLTLEVKTAMLFQHVMNPNTLRNSDSEWLLALSSAVTGFYSE